MCIYKVNMSLASVTLIRIQATYGFKNSIYSGFAVEMVIFLCIRRLLHDTRAAIFDIVLTMLRTSYDLLLEFYDFMRLFESQTHLN